MRRTQVITEGAILLAIFLVLMMAALYAPLIGTLFLFILPLPYMIYTIRHGLSPAILLLAAGSILSILFGSITNILLVLTFGLGGVTMGFFYQRKNTMGAIIGGSLSYTISMVLSYVGSILFLQIDMIKDTIRLLKDSFEQSKAILSGISPGADVEKQFANLEEVLELIVTLTPTMFVATGVVLALLSHLAALPVLKRLKIDFSTLKPFREWRLPASLVWYYLIVSVLLMVNIEPESFYFMAVLNLYFILQFFIIIQGYSFMYYYSYQKKISKGITTTIVIVSLLMPILLYLVRILGIIDLCFPLRGKITKR